MVNNFDSVGPGDYLVSKLIEMSSIKKEKNGETIEDCIDTVIWLENNPNLKIDFERSGINNGNDLVRKLGVKNNKELFDKFTKVRGRAITVPIEGSYLLKIIDNETFYLLDEKEKSEITEIILKTEEKIKEKLAISESYLNKKDFYPATENIHRSAEFLSNKVPDSMVKLYIPLMQLVVNQKRKVFKEILLEITEKSEDIGKAYNTCSVEDAFNHTFFKERKKEHDIIANNYQLLVDNFIEILKSQNVEEDYLRINKIYRTTYTQGLNFYLQTLKFIKSAEEHYQRTTERIFLKKINGANQLNKKLAVKKIVNNVIDLDKKVKILRKKSRHQGIFNKINEIYTTQSISLINNLAELILKIEVSEKVRRKVENIQNKYLYEQIALFQSNSTFYRYKN